LNPLFERLFEQGLIQRKQNQHRTNHGNFIDKQQEVWPSMPKKRLTVEKTFSIDILWDSTVKASQMYLKFVLV